MGIQKAAAALRQVENREEELKAERVRLRPDDPRLAELEKEARDLRESAGRLRWVIKGSKLIWPFILLMLAVSLLRFLITGS